MEPMRSVLLANRKTYRAVESRIVGAQKIPAMFALNNYCSTYLGAWQCLVLCPDAPDGLHEIDHNDVPKPVSEMRWEVVCVLVKRMVDPSEFPAEIRT